jgi:subtilisin family serine protease
MTDIQPAYSAPFRAQALRQVPSIDSLEDLTPDWAWGGSTGRGVKVAVIDSGIDGDHPALGGDVSGYVSIAQGPDGLEYNTQSHRDAVGHGTACAGIIRSFAPDCELYSVKVLGPGLGGRGSAFAAGLRWAIDNGMHVCNLSLGTSKADFFGPLHELADLAYFRNVILVAAANNLPVPTFPAVYASVISVAACAPQRDGVFFYNPDPPVEFGAPGISVRVPWRDGAWLTATGNSFAAPHISGVIARILGKHPGLTPFQVKVILRALSANVASTNGASQPAQPRRSDSANC